MYVNVVRKGDKAEVVEVIESGNGTRILRPVHDHTIQALAVDHWQRERGSVPMIVRKPNGPTLKPTAETTKPKDDQPDFGVFGKMQDKLTQSQVDKIFGPSGPNKQSSPLRRGGKITLAHLRR